MLLSSFNPTFQVGGLPLGASWTIVAVQPIICAPGFAIVESSLTCQACTFPTTSSGGAEQCTHCIEGYFRKDGVCLACPKGATCYGGTWLPLPIEGCVLFSDSSCLRNDFGKEPIHAFSYVLEQALGRCER